MNIELPSFAGPRGWPTTGCICASCNRLRLAGTRHKPARIVIDGVPLEDCTRTRVPGGYDVTSASGERALVADAPGSVPQPVADVEYSAVLLDLVGSPEHLGYLRHRGAATSKTEVMAVHVDHRISSPAELERRVAFWGRPPDGPFRTLLLGGTRSGKSAEAELSLAACPEVTYVASGMVRRDDLEWTARIASQIGR